MRKVGCVVGVVELIVLSGILISLLAFNPGWMSNDSGSQYAQAITGRYNDWHPVLMAWWWRQLDQVFPGPALMLLQSILLYWGTFYFFAKGHHSRSTIIVSSIAALGFFPALLLPLGHIWKDVLFAAAIMFVFAVLRYHQARQTRPGPFVKIMLTALIVLAVGSKVNGATALPFLFGYWLHVERPTMRTARKVGLAILLSIAVFLAPKLIVKNADVFKAHGFQYTQLHDLLGISVKVGKVLLPQYVVDKTKLTEETAKIYYGPNSNNWLFYSVAGPLTTYEAEELRDLNARWRNAIREHPYAYLEHRFEVLAAVLRFGESTPAWVVVADPKHLTNPPPFSFHDNVLSSLLKRSVSDLPWLYLPWVYLIVIVGSLVVAARRRDGTTAFPLLLCGAALAFIAPHLLVAPADDYRYLYFSYFCALFAAIDLALTSNSAFGRRRRLAVT